MDRNHKQDVNDDDVNQTARPSLSQNTFGQRWLHTENKARTSYYKHRANLLFQEVLDLQQDPDAEQDQDPFLIIWDLLNTIVAILELEPDNAASWIFAGQMSYKLVAVDDSASYDDVLGYFIRATQLAPESATEEIRLFVLQAIENDDEKDRLFAQKLDRLFNNNANPLPVIPRRSQAFQMLSSLKHKGVPEALDAIIRTKAISGKGAIEPGDLEYTPPTSTSTSTSTSSIDSTTASTTSTASAASISSKIQSNMRTIAMWPTYLVSINLMKEANLTKQENELLSSLAIEHFLQFKDVAESEALEQNQQLTPNDLDDGFFGYQHSNPYQILKKKPKRDIVSQWPKLYGRGTKGREIYIRVVRAIRRVCEEYIQAYARPGTLENAKQYGFSEDFWSAVYIPKTVHSHHTHQMSVVSAVYYSKAGKQNTPIVFNDPRGAGAIHNYEQYEQEHDFEPEAPFHQQLSYFPEEGELILFPSWLVHKVPTHKGIDDRVSWPYNYRIESTWDAWSRTVLI